MNKHIDAYNIKFYMYVQYKYVCMYVFTTLSNFNPNLDLNAPFETSHLQ